MKTITLRDVSVAAGVSRQTVSRVLNERPDVAPETRRRVQDIIERLGYRPNSLARSLVQGRSYTLGVISYGVKYFGPANTLDGIEGQASEMGYSLHLSLVRDPTESSIENLYEMLSYHVDGIIWAVPEIGTNRDWVQREIDNIPVPVVFLDMEPHPGLMIVNIDNRRGGYIAANHLLFERNQHIGLITGPLDWWSARQRMAGWQDALEERGMTVDEGFVVEGTWSAASGERGLLRLLEQRPDVDAVFACNDQMALGALKALHEKGMRVPHDLAIIGFDNVPETPFFSPPLTTVRTDLDELGRSAVRELKRLIEAKQENQSDIERYSIHLTPELIVRESSLRSVTEIRGDRPITPSSKLM